MEKTFSPVDATIISKKSAVSQYGVKPEMVLKEPSVVLLQMTRADVRQVERQGPDLVIALLDGQVVIVRNFFDAKGHVSSHLVLTDDAEGLWLMDTVSGEGKVRATYSNLYTIDPLLDTATAQNAGHADTMPTGTGLLAWGAGLGALTLASMLGSNGKKDNPQGTVDDARPEAATVNSPTGEWPLTGTATPGHTVKITFPSGNTAEVKVEDDGSFSADLPAAETLRQGEQITVEVVSADGLTSEATLVQVDPATALNSNDLLNQGDTLLDDMLARVLGTSSNEAALPAVNMADRASPTVDAGDAAALLQITQQISLI